ncbi:hypothetical protein BY996DRAFT_8404662 [Phakopsora pachyrhizi]|nr:hypothetical protein BY996DRAFT_8404662 [Phakopsora pachyrhizi]
MSRYPPLQPTNYPDTSTQPSSSRINNSNSNHHHHHHHQEDSLPYDQSYHHHQPYNQHQQQSYYANEPYQSDYQPDQFQPPSAIYENSHQNYLEPNHQDYSTGYEPSNHLHPNSLPQHHPPGPKGMDDYFNDYDHHSNGVAGSYAGNYDYDEKSYHHNLQNQYPPSPNPISLDPPGFGGTALNTPTRGLVAAQMAAEGAIPEKAGLRMWRSDEHSGAFTRGGKGKCCGRCCCCTTIVIAVIIVGIIAGFLLWFRPPNATFNGIAPPTAGNQVDLQPSGFLLNFDLKVGVTNPNFFGASFSQIAAKAFYPLNKTSPIGGGELDNVEIKPHSNTTINFPFQINYTSSLDPNRAILADIANKCGFLGASKD